MTCNRIIPTMHERRISHRRSAQPASRPSDVLAFLSSCVLAATLVVGGCAGGSFGNQQNFILPAVRQGGPGRPVTDGLLEVHRFSIDAAFVAKNLVYRLGEFKYEVDSYRQFLIAPGTMITERTRDWLADSGLFNTVLPVGSRVVPTYTLEGNVIALYGDFIDESAPTAVMEIRFFLLKNAEGAETVVFTQTYGAATAVSSRTTDDFVRAMDQSLVEILTRLEADLSKALAGGGDRPTDSVGG